MKTDVDLWIEKAEKFWDKKDYKQAAQWYRKAAIEGDAGAQYCLGWLYYAALGVKLDEAEAAKWFRMAAEQGVSEAQKALGDMYLRGEGVEKSDAEALNWYHKAADQGDKEAERLAEQIIHALELMI